MQAYANAMQISIWPDRQCKIFGSSVGTITDSCSQVKTEIYDMSSWVSTRRESRGEIFFYHFTSHITAWYKFHEFRKIVHSRNWKTLVRISLAKCDVKQYSCCQIVSVAIKHIWKITYSHLPSLDIKSCQFLYSMLLSLWNAGYGFLSQENINNREEKNLISYNKNTGFMPDIQVFHTKDQQSFITMGGNKEFVIAN